MSAKKYIADRLEAQRVVPAHAPWEQLSVPVGIERTFPVAGQQFWKSVIPIPQLAG